MATFLILGTYTNKGAKGLVEKNSDRREAMKTLASSVGAKFIDYSITRGILSLIHISEPTRPY